MTLASPVAAAESLVAMVHFAEPAQAPETVELGATGQGVLDLAMGYTVERLEFSRPVRRARVRTFVALVWRVGRPPDMRPDGFVRALALAWGALPCEGSECRFDPAWPSSREASFLPTGKVRLAPVLASVRAIAANPRQPAARRAAARAALRRCTKPAAASRCVALATEDEIEVRTEGSPQPRTLVLSYEID